MSSDTYKKQTKENIMHLPMSSYTDAECLPPVLYSHLSPAFSFRSIRSDEQNTGLIRISPFDQDRSLELLHFNYNHHGKIMSPEFHDLHDSEDNSAIADLVRSDDQFLDLLEIMHYLSFSDR